MWKIMLAAVMPAFCAGMADAANISTLDLVSGEARPWGRDDTSVYGQVVSFGDAVVARAFEFRLDDSATPISFNVSVYAWVNDNVSGGPLVTTSGRTQGISGYQTYEVDLGAVRLPAGQYVVLVEATSPGTATYAMTEGAYSGGAWVYQSKAPGAVLSASWFVSATSDLAFTLHYNPAPN